MSSCTNEPDITPDLGAVSSDVEWNLSIRVTLMTKDIISDPDSQVRVTVYTLPPQKTIWHSPRWP